MLSLYIAVLKVTTLIMKKLSKTHKAMILLGAKFTGSFFESYCYIEEMLTCKEAGELYGFCNWIDKEVGYAGEGNIEKLFLAYKTPNDPELKKFAQETAERIKLYRR